MPYAYVTVEAIKSTAVINITSTAHDTRLRNLIEHVSQQIDRFCNRRFQPVVELRYFDGNAKTALLSGDLIAITTLKEDSNGDGTFNTTWNVNDFHLTPHNAAATSDYGRPYNKIVVNPASVGTQDVFLDGFRNYEIDGTWGYFASTLDTGGDSSGGDLAATATTLITDGSGTFEAGMTIALAGTAAEMLYITSFSGSRAQVLRGQNGSTAALIPNDLGLSFFVYPGPIVEACLMQSIRLWTRRNSGFADEVGFEERGRRILIRGLDPDVKQLLTSYRKIAL